MPRRRSSSRSPHRRTGMDSEAVRDVARNNAPPSVAAGIVVIWGTLAADVVVLDVRHCLLFGQIRLIDLA